MIESYPFGKAPFWLTVVAFASMLGVIGVQVGSAKSKPDLVLALSAPNHVISYRKVEERFEREHGIDVALQLVNLRPSPRGCKTRCWPAPRCLTWPSYRSMPCATSAAVD